MRRDGCIFRGSTHTPFNHITRTVHYSTYNPADSSLDSRQSRQLLYLSFFSTTSDSESSTSRNHAHLVSRWCGQL